MATIRLDAPPVEVVLRRSARARRFSLTVPQDGRPPQLTAPRAAPAAEIRMFLMRQRDWLAAALIRAPAAMAVEPGAAIPVAGRMLTLDARPGPRRAPVIEDGRLILPGAGPAGPRVAAWLKTRARDALVPAARDYAARLGRPLGRVSLRDQKGRWGSCSSAGNLNFSWRLAMAPAHVLDYVAAHEAAHLVELNHSPAFWTVVERVSPDWRAARDWLRREGPALHRYRFA